MDPDKKIEKTLEEYQNIAKENKDIDVAALMINTLQSQSQRQNGVSPRLKKWAYGISLLLPPLGLAFAVKFYFFDDKEDAVSVGNICIILTVVAVAAFWLTTKLFFSNAGTSLQQIRQIKPSDVQQLYQ